MRSNRTTPTTTLDNTVDLYNYLWERHNTKAERLAAGNPEWAAIQSKRGPDGLTLLNDSLRWEDWERQHEIEHELYPMPLYLRVLGHFRPVHRKLNPYWWRRNFQIRWERSKKGWSYRDTWDLRSYLAGVVEGSVREMRKRAHGWPGDPMTFDEWLQILDDIADGFAAGQEIDEVETPEEEAELRAKFDKGMELFHKWYFHLWD